MGDALGSLYAEQHFSTQNKRKVKFSSFPAERLMKTSLDLEACFIVMPGRTIGLIMRPSQGFRETGEQGISGEQGNKV